MGRHQRSQHTCGQEGVGSEDAVRISSRYKRSLHLIEDNPFEDQGCLGVTWILVFQSPSLLPEIKFSQAREKGRIQINGQEIPEVLGVLRGKRVQSIVTSCEGIHKSGERPVQHFEERISARVFLRATQDCVLKNVRDSGTVHGRGSKLQAEQVIRVFSGQVQVSRSCAIMAELHGGQEQFRDRRYLAHSESTDLLSNLVLPLPLTGFGATPSPRSEVGTATFMESHQR